MSRDESGSALVELTWLSLLLLVPLVYVLLAVFAVQSGSYAVSGAARAAARAYALAPDEASAPGRAGDARAACHPAPRAPPPPAWPRARRSAPARARTGRRAR